MLKNDIRTLFEPLINSCGLKLATQDFMYFGNKLAPELSLFPSALQWDVPGQRNVNSGFFYILAQKLFFCATLFSQLVRAFDLIPFLNAQTGYSLWHYCLRFLNFFLFFIWDEFYHKKVTFYSRNYRWFSSHCNTISSHLKIWNLFKNSKQ